LVLLGVTAIVVIVAILSDNNASEVEITPTPTQTQEPETGATEEPEVEQAPAKVLVLRSEIIGENLSAVTARLTEQGFEVNAIPGELIPGTDPRVRTVYAVSPTGSLDKGTRIDVTYYVGDFASIPVEIPEPEPPVTESPSVSDTVSPEIGESEDPEDEPGSDD
jgi:serine/threonine-protein kinase